MKGSEEIGSVRCKLQGEEIFREPRLVEVLHHGLRPPDLLPTDGTPAGLGVVLLLEVSVQGLGEGGPQATDVTLPGLVVLVISVHVVHQPSEPPTLEVTQLTDTKLPATLRYLLLCNLAHQPRLGRSISGYWATSPPLVARSLVAVKATEYE